MIAWVSSTAWNLPTLGFYYLTTPPFPPFLIRRVEITQMISPLHPQKLNPFIHNLVFFPTCSYPPPKHMNKLYLLTLKNDARRLDKQLIK